MNIFGNRVYMVGDQVQYKGRGGSKRTHENVWEIIEISSDMRSVAAKVCLIKGLINDSNNHEYGPGYVRYYFLKDLKHVEEGEQHRSFLFRVYFTLYNDEETIKWAI